MPFAPLTPSASESDDDDSMDTDGDESDVEFWGGESPRAQRFPRSEHEMVIDDSEEEDDEDSEDEDMSDETEEDEADDYNQMELLGHR